MARVASPHPAVQPTNLAPLPALLAYTQALALARFLARRNRGFSPLVLSLVWLTLAWRGSGRREHLEQFTDPLLVALLACGQLPSPQTLRVVTLLAMGDVRSWGRR